MIGHELVIFNVLILCQKLFQLMFPTRMYAVLNYSVQIHLLLLRL